MKPTWFPWGALGLLTVNALPLPATPAPPINAQGEPLGTVWNTPVPTAGVSNPPSGTTTELAATVRTKACVVTLPLLAMTSIEYVPTAVVADALSTPVVALNVTPVGGVPTSESVGVGEPVAVTVNVP